MRDLQHIAILFFIGKELAYRIEHPYLIIICNKIGIFIFNKKSYCVDQKPKPYKYIYGEHAKYGWPKRIPWKH